MPSINDPMTVKAIAREYCSNGRVKEKALLDADYKPSYARSKGMRLYEDKRLIEEIERIDASTREKAEWDRDIAIAGLTVAKQWALDKKNVKDYVACARELSAITGLHVQTVQTKDLSAPVVSVEEQAELDALAARYKVKLANTK